MDNEIKVSICCIVYNHEKFLRKCLDGLVNQKTDFKFEAIVHDDVSTDNSINIIKEYQEKYPEIIKPIFEKENKYSQGINLMNEIFMPIVKGKYVTICEGDDYWCDENKLQEQYDLMEKNPDCSMCVHNSIWHDLSGKTKDVKFNDWNEIRYLNDRDVFFPGKHGWNIHTSSYFIRKEFASQPKEVWGYWFGDYVTTTNAYYHGKIIYIPKVMSIYNANNINGAALKATNKENLKKRAKLHIEYLEKFNNYTKKKYEKIINEKILLADFEEILFEFLINNYNYNEFKENKKKIEKHVYYKSYIDELNVCKKIKFYIKHKFFITYKLFKLVKR